MKMDISVRMVRWVTCWLTVRNPAFVPQESITPEGTSWQNSLKTGFGFAFVKYACDYWHKQMGVC